MNQDRCFFCMEKLPVPGATCSCCGKNNRETAAAQPSHAMRCGTVLGGKYLLGRVLGRGGFGMTYLALDMALDTRVCIKEYLPEGIALRDSRRSPTVFWTSSAKTDKLRQGRERFVREAQKAARVRDLHSVVKVWDVFQANDTAYIVMDYVEGETLKHHLIRTGTPLTEAQCVERFGPVMADLEQIHQRGIVHRDISPDNLMLNKNGELILLDLGAAKDLSGGSGQSAFLVTRRGFSPLEQYSQSGVIGPWTDVYALCATIVYCVTGRLIPEPLERYSGVELDLSGFTPAFAAVLEKGLAIEPEKRYQSTSELLEALHAALTRVEEVAKDADSAPSQDAKPDGETLPETQTRQAEKKENTEKKEKTNKSRLILPVAAAIALLAVGLFLLFSQSAAITGLFEIKNAKNMPVRTEDLIDKGRLCSDEGDYAAALECFLQAVEAGNSGAMEDIRALYAEDRLTEQEQEALRSRLTASVEEGNAAAMTAIGDLYAYGLGMETNADKARAWYAKAVNAGDESALEAAAALETAEDMPEASEEDLDVLTRENLNESQNKNYDDGSLDEEQEAESNEEITIEEIVSSDGSRAVIKSDSAGNILEYTNFDSEGREDYRYLYKKGANRNLNTAAETVTVYNDNQGKTVTISNYINAAPIKNITETKGKLTDKTITAYAADGVTKNDETITKYTDGETVTSSEAP